MIFVVNFYSWLLFVNWRYYVFEVYMKMGDDKGVFKFVLKKFNLEVFYLFLLCGVWFWIKALFDDRYKE